MRVADSRSAIVDLGPVTAPYRIPFNRPVLVGREVEYMAQAVAAGHISGGGPFTRRAEAVLEEVLGAPRVFLTTSCSHALEMAALLGDVAPGDEVIVPSFTFVTSASSFVLRGARPVFVDIRPDTLNIDEERIEAAITPRTRAIVLVHYAGVGCEMAEILAIAERHGLPIVEDNAHGLFGSYRGAPLGSFGRFATLSFHETKNLTCGEGGALVVNDPAFAERAEILREKGTNRGRFFRGEVDKYTWVDVGSSYIPAELLAAFLLAQLERREAVQATRRRIWDAYADGLADWAAESGSRMPVIPADRDQAYHMFYLLLPSLERRQELIAHLKSRSILSVFHYLPLHLSEVGRRYGGRAGDCPVTEDVSDRLLRLPFYNDLSESDQARVIEAIRDWRA